MRASSKAARLLALLADGKWHSNGECSRVAGLRFGARVLEIRRGLMGLPPMNVAMLALDTTRGLYAYRLASESVATLREWRKQQMEAAQ